MGAASRRPPVAEPSRLPRLTRVPSSLAAPGSRLCAQMDYLLLCCAILHGIRHGWRMPAWCAVIRVVGFYLLVVREHNVYCQRALSGVLTAALLLRGAWLKN